MTEALRYLLAVEIVGWVAWPLLARALPALPDRGYALAKTAGLFALALTDSWLLASGLLPELGPVARTGVALALLGGASAALLAAPQSPLPSLRRTLAARRAAIGLFEAVFLATFAAGLVLRALAPGIEHTEQPMDRMLLGAVQEARAWPVMDPWLSGEPLAYYALGHVAVAAPARLAAVRPDVAYNLGLAAWGAVLATGAAGVAFALARPLLPRRRRAALAAALGGVSLLAVSGAAAVRDALAQLPALLAGRPGSFWWWWGSSRTLVDRAGPGAPAELIHETPGFSWLIGDLHAHFLALPLMLLGTALALELARRPRRGAALGLAALLGGAALAANTWTFPALAVLLLASVWASGTARPGRASLLLGGALLAGGWAIALPCLIFLRAGPRALVVNALDPSDPGALAALWLPILPALGALLALSPRRARPGFRRVAIVALAGGLAAALGAPVLALAARAEAGGELLRSPLGVPAPGAAATLAARGVGGFVVPLVLGAAVAYALACAHRAGPVRGPADAARRAALVFAATGLAMVLVPELVYLLDGHASRLNTVFKLHSSAWPPLLLAASAGVAQLVAARRSGWALLAAAPILASAVYPLAIGIDRWLSADTPPTLDALVPLARESPAEAAAILWTRANVPAGETVLQAPAASYDPTAVRTSVFAARPTLLGWMGHEAQWRGAAFGEVVAGREAAARTVYESADAAAKAAALARFGIGWVHVGPAERRRYDVSAASRLALEAVAEVVFESGDVLILRVREP